MALCSVCGGYDEPVGDYDEVEDDQDRDETDHGDWAEIQEWADALRGDNVTRSGAAPGCHEKGAVWAV